MVKKLLFAAGFVLMTLGLSSTCWAAVDYSGIIESEANWISGLAVSTGNPADKANGGIVMTWTHTWDLNEATNGSPPQYYYKIEPYFANLAVLGMLEHPTANNINTAKNWMQWYFNNLNTPDYNALNGTVYKHFLDPTNLSIDKVQPGYDSTDSYGASFLLLAKKYYEVTRDSTFLVNNRSKIEMIADSVLATQQTDGLTYAKPDYQIKFTMDNTEVSDGLASMVWLEKYIYNDLTKANNYQTKKDSNSNGIESSLWNAGANNYKTYVGATSNWSTFYPDATAQLFPMWNGLISPSSSRAKNLYSMFNANQPAWPNLSADPGGFPWAVTAYSAALMGDKARVDAFLSNVKTTYINTGHPFKWYDMEAGFTIRAAKTIRDMYNLGLNKTISASSNPSTASNVNDGDLVSSWVSAAANNEWLAIDLGQSTQFNRVLIKWNADYADQFKIQVSDDGITYTDANTVTAGTGGTNDIMLGSTQTKRYVKLLFTHRATANGVSLREIEVYDEASDLALNKTATASSNQSDAYKSVDGSTSTRWGSAYADNEWYKLDLGSTTSINKAVIDWETAYDTAYSIQTSNDDISYTTVYSTTTGQGGVEEIRFPATNARYVKLLCTTRATPYGSSFWEFRVYNDNNYYAPIPAPSPNLALNKTATASSNQADAYKSVDGSTSTRWGSAYADNEWYKVDLGSTTSINKAVINWEAAYDSVYSIQTSTDDITYTTVYSTTTGQGGVEEIRFPATNARYVKLLCTTRATPYGSSFWEFEVYSVPNLALNKTATASSFQADAYKSVDGNTSTRWGSAYANNEWYKVDLGSTNRIKKVVINWEAAYDTAYSIQTSNDDITYTTVYSTTTGHGGIEAISLNPINARYVKLLCTTRATPYGSSFWEFEVYNQ